MITSEDYAFLAIVGVIALLIAFLLVKAFEWGLDD